MKIKKRVIPAKPRSKELLNRYYHSGFSNSSSNTSDGGGLGSTSYWELIDTDAEGNPLTEPYILTKYSAVSERELTAHKVGTGGGGEPIVGVTSLNNLTDVDLSSPLSGHMLVYNGTHWVNQEATGTGGSYVHPATHPASMIVEDSTRRFVTDTEKDFWNAKETIEGAQAKADGALSSAKDYTDGKVKTDVPLNAKFTDTIVDISGKVDKKTGFSLISDTEITRLSNVTNQDLSNYAKKTYVDTEVGKKWTYDETTIKAVKVSNAIRADNVGGFTVGINVPSNAKFTDTIVDISGKADKTTLTAHTGNTRNPHSVTKAQVGLSNVTNHKQAKEVHTHTIANVTGLQDELDNKENKFTKKTAFNKNFGSVQGTVTEGNDSRLHTHSNTAYLNNIDQYLAKDKAVEFKSVKANDFILKDTLDTTQSVREFIDKFNDMFEIKNGAIQAKYSLYSLGELTAHTATSSGVNSIKLMGDMNANNFDINGVKNIDTLGLTGLDNLSLSNQLTVPTISSTNGKFTNRVEAKEVKIGKFTLKEDASGRLGVFVNNTQKAHIDTNGNYTKL